jgi:hypothetical protein
LYSLYVGFFDIDCEYIFALSFLGVQQKEKVATNSVAAVVIAGINVPRDSKKNGSK